MILHRYTIAIVQDGITKTITVHAKDIGAALAIQDQIEEWTKAELVRLEDSQGSIDSSVYGLTPKMLDCFNFIKTFKTQKRTSPSYRQIGEALGISSTSNVHRLVHSLVERGHIRLIAGHARTIQVLK